MGICLSTADACIKTADDAVNDFLDRQSSFYKESKQVSAAIVIVCYVSCDPLKPRVCCIAI